MSILPAALFDFDFFKPLPIQIEVSEAPLTSDAGLLPLRQFDERIGLTKQFASGTRRTHRNGCSRGSGIEPVPGRCPGLSW